MVGGSSGKWLKSLTDLRKESNNSDQENFGGNGKEKKWKKLWRNSSWTRGSSGRNRPSPSEVGSETSSVIAAADKFFDAAIAAVVRAPAKDFKVVREEWAAIRIQTAFRGFLARRALKALKGIVRLQALIRGRKVRKQAELTLRCMQTLVRVQARARAHRARVTAEGEVMKASLEGTKSEIDHLREEGWCESPGSMQEVRAKLKMREESSVRRERAITYALSQQSQQWRSTSSGRSKLSGICSKHHDNGKSNWNWNWLDSWMAEKPWESERMEETLSSRNYRENMYENSPNYIEYASTNVKRNNITTRRSAKPPVILSSKNQKSNLIVSSLKAEHLYGESCTSSSSPSTATSKSVCIFLDSGKSEQSSSSKPKFMSLTESTKAKKKSYNARRARLQRQISDDSKLNEMSAFSTTNIKRNTGTEPSNSSSSVKYSVSKKTNNSTTTTRYYGKENCAYNDRLDGVRKCA